MLNTEINKEGCAFILGDNNDTNKKIKVSYTELVKNEIGHTWTCKYTSRKKKTKRTESATLVYRDDNGVAVLFRSQNFIVALEWFEFLNSNKKQQEKLK